MNPDCREGLSHGCVSCHGEGDGGELHVASHVSKSEADLIVQLRERWPLVWVALPTLLHQGLVTIKKYNIVCFQSVNDVQDVDL